MASELIIVQAIYSFKGTNNDELCFKKGDKITITQKEEGGWWEGTLADKTGWFPSNYVKECKDTSPAPIASPAQQKQYRSIVLQDMIESERAHVTEQLGLVNNFLQPLEKSAVLSQDEYRQLTGNLIEVLDAHQQLLRLLEDEETKASEGQRVGRLFLSWASRIKNVHQAYCALHPRAAYILEKYRDELTTYMESCGATSPGVLVLTIGLSKPFRRLDKYSGMLQELERHLEESHSDRGDTQRSVAVYKEIATVCSATRRQKELELQVLTGAVRGWEGQSLATLGEIMYMGSVAIGPQHHDRYFILFPTTLLILSVSPRLSAFVYEGKLPLTGINVNRLEDSDQYKNAFEINGHLIEKRIAVCQSREEANYWVDLLRKFMPHKPGNINQKMPLKAEFVPQSPPHMSPLTSHGVAASNKNRIGAPVNTNVRTACTNTLNNNPGWSASCLRPAPPLRPCLALGTNANGTPIKSSRKPLTYKEDGLILEVIEAYCNTKTRSTVNSVNCSPTTNDSPPSKLTEMDRNVLEMLQLLKNRIVNLETNLATLSTQLMEERGARCALQVIVKNQLVLNGKDFDGIDWPTMETNILN